MADLLTRLQDALGSGYRVEKELGGGGMSRVFLAEEVRLDRRVVVKVLPPEMAAGVSEDRFEREIQLAAKLQHPHIVPLLTAGSSDDLLYYIMPFIEGESLRAKLAREGELPVPEALQILRDVLDALAYAHRHQVVHRDIKPDNVLLSEGHALVTDFGVAKAVAESTGRHTLTSMGVALGTPAYMAPEQATADPHTDHRADLYAVGALAYEMLSGRPPFMAMNAQAMLAAHVTEAPEPVTKHRASVPPALNELILRCLAKKPADRWQRADELIPQVAAMLTPTGGTTPTGTQPAISSGTAAAIERAHPVRVAALFGLASVGVLAIVYAAVQLIGLPDWVFYGAIALLGIGLPIMVVTGHHERRRALGRANGTPETAPPGGLKRFLTWRRTLLGGGLAFAALGVVTAGYLAMRALGIGPVGTLVASGVLDRGARVILADFSGRTGDTTLPTTFTEAFRVDLAQSRAIRLVASSEIRAVLERMRRDPGTRVSLDVAREIAVREGIPAVVSGEINPAGVGYVLAVQLVTAERGDVIAAFRETARDSTELIGAIDRLSNQLRERIGESLKALRASPPLSRVTTGSLDALRKYSLAYRTQAAGDVDRAIALLEEVVAMDTAFASAYRALAVSLANTGAEPSRVAAAATKAYQLRARLPDVERQLATAFYFMAAARDIQQEIAAYRSVLEIDPEHPTALNNLAVKLVDLGQWEQGAALARRALAAGSTVWQHYWILALAQFGLGDLAAAESTVTAMQAMHPDHPWTMFTRANLHNARRDHRATALVLDSMADRYGASGTWRTWGSLALAATAEARGRLAEADTYFRAVGLAREDPATYLATETSRAWLDVRYRDRPGAGVSRVAAALERLPLSGVAPEDRPYLMLAEFYAWAGQPERARDLLGQWERAVSSAVVAATPERLSVVGAIALAEGRLEDGVQAYRAWGAPNTPRGLYPPIPARLTSLCPATCGLYQLAVAYDRQGRMDSALAYYERVLVAPADLRVLAEYSSRAPALKRAGELHEQRGDRERAIERYHAFVELWNEADPELQPVVRDVRARIARLVAER